MTAVLSTRCSECGKALTDRLSRRYGIGPDCRSQMTPTQLVDAIRRNQPGYIPKARPATAQARRNHSEIQRVTENPTEAARCVHEAIPANCALCRRDNNPWRCAERIIAITLAAREKRRAKEYAAYQAKRAPGVGEGGQIFQPGPTPDAEQLALEAS